MGNCLKTQLKSVVNNDNLELLGYTNVYFDANEDLTLRQFVLGITSGKSIKVLQGKVYSDAQRTVEIPSTYTPNSVTRYYIGAEKTIIEIPKYSIINYNLSAVSNTMAEGYCSSDFINYNTLEGSVGIQSNDTINMNAFSNNNTLERVFLKGIAVDGDLSCFASSIGTLKNIVIDNVIDDSILSLVAFSELELLKCKGVRGELNTFAEQMNVTRKSGSLRVYGNNKITVNGTTIPTDMALTITFSDEGYTIS